MPRDAEPAAAAEPGYNTVFERLDADSSPEGAVAYALYKAAKREWLKDFRRSNGRNPTEAELDAYSRTRNDLTLSAYRAQAMQIVAEFAERVSRSIRPAIVAETLQDSFWGSVKASIVASLLFSLGLICLYVIAGLFGVGLPIQINLPARP